MKTVNSEKILNSLPKLQQLDEKGFDLILSAVDSCLAVQALEQASKNPLALKKIVASINA